jgi:pimeloyl-ACP methyl ester carboxylesterase
MMLGDTEHWVLVRGRRVDAPILLKVHGGPGQAEIPTIHMNARLEEHFLVVEWDQRGAGKSAPADSEVALPVALLATSRIKPRRSLSLALRRERYCDAASVAAGPQPREFVARRRRPRRGSPMLYVTRQL